MKCNDGEGGCTNPNDPEQARFDGQGGRGRDGPGGPPGRGGPPGMKGGPHGKGGPRGGRGRGGRRDFGDEFGTIEILVTVIIVLVLVLIGVSFAYYKKSKETAAMIPTIQPSAAHAFELPNTSNVMTTKNFDDTAVVGDKHEMV